MNSAMIFWDGAFYLPSWSELAVTVGLTEPLTATVLGITVLGEVLSPLGAAGLATVLVGLIIVSLPSRKYPGSLEEAHA